MSPSASPSGFQQPTSVGVGPSRPYNDAALGVLRELRSALKGMEESKILTPVLFGSLSIKLQRPSGSSSVLDGISVNALPFVGITVDSRGQPQFTLGIVTSAFGDRGVSTEPLAVGNDAVGALRALWIAEALPEFSPELLNRIATHVSSAGPADLSRLIILDSDQDSVFQLGGESDESSQLLSEEELRGIFKKSLVGIDELIFELGVCGGRSIYLPSLLSAAQSKLLDPVEEYETTTNGVVIKEFNPSHAMMMLDRVVGVRPPRAAAAPMVEGFTAKGLGRISEWVDVSVRRLFDPEVPLKHRALKDSISQFVEWYAADARLRVNDMMQLASDPSSGGEVSERLEAETLAVYLGGVREWVIALAASRRGEKLAVGPALRQIRELELALIAAVKQAEVLAKRSSVGPIAKNGEPLRQELPVQVLDLYADFNRVRRETLPDLYQFVPPRISAFE